MPLSAPDYQFLKNLVYKDSAIVLGDDHAYLLEARLGPLAQLEGVADVTALVRVLQKAADPALRRRVVETMTTNETSFFRDIQPFEVLKNTILPELVKKRATERSLRIWSGAASTGQEACSLAMTLLEHQRDVALGWDVQILGTDLSSRVVERAKSGLYSQLEVNRGLPAPMLMKHFTRSGVQWQTSSAVQRLVQYRVMNLAAAWPLMPQFDIIFLRNVLIYFDMDTRRAIFTRLRNCLRKDGVLFIGGAESIREADDALECVRAGSTQYYRHKTQPTAGIG
jgi:chemotaxis protein methyltransferase CheR